MIPQYFHDRNFYSKSHRLGAISHPDARFAPQLGLDHAEFRVTLLALLESFLYTTHNANTKAWLAHGTLLGWWWNQALLPWDTDLDVHIMVGDLTRLVSDYNMTETSHQASVLPAARRYLLDINPHFSTVTLDDVANKIDGRWIDTSNGKFIDITAIHQHDQAPDVLFCKDGHRYSVQQLLPLQQSTFHGVDVYIPAAPDEVLIEEYGAKALTNTHFHWHVFDLAAKLWKFQEPS